MREGYGVGLWKVLRKEYELLSSRISFLVGNSRKVRFWKDEWCGDDLFCVVFPSLFVLAISKEVWVGNVWDLLVEGSSWNLCLSRPFDD